MRAALRKLSTRDIRLLQIAGAALLAILLFQFGYMPLLSFRADAARDRAAAESLLEGVEMRAARLAMLARRAGTPPPANPALLRQAVASAAQARGIALSRLAPEGDGGLSVSIDRTSAEALFGWLVALDHEAGVRVARASIGRDNASGMLRAQLRFAGEGG